MDGVSKKRLKKKKDEHGDDKTQKLGVTFVLIVLSLYAFGCFESIRSLPDIDPKAIVMSRIQFADLIKDSATDAEAHLLTGASVEAELDAAKANSLKADPAKTNLAGKVRAKADTPAGGTLLKADWPLSIRNEDGTFEEIVHPGDDKVTLAVPQFWSLPVHNGKLMTRELAMSIGSCVSGQTGDACPAESRTIFVAIASYRDWQCRHTVESIFGRAAHPERVRVGVVDQIVDGEDVKCSSPIQPCSVDPEQALCKYKDRVDVYEVDAPLAVGPVFARHLGHRLYRGEYYTMQSDAHVTYTTAWDDDIIKQHESTRNEMAILSTYLTDVTDSIDDKGNSLRKTRPIMCNTDYEGGQQGQHLRHLSQPERYPSIRDTPQLQPYWAAGFSFGRGHFVVNVPYDLYQPMIFQGEEMSIGLRGFTIGYDYYAPQRSVCFHHYAVGKNLAKRNQVKHFWENADRYRGTGIRAMARLLGIVNMNPEVPRSNWNHAEEERYGIGNVRTTQKFYDTFGIDVVNKRTEHNLCTFVEQGHMHNLFTKFLRTDGMGIDYSKIDYQFKDPLTNAN